MTSADHPDLSALSRSAGGSADIPHPPSRVLTRLLLPAAIIIAALALTAYAAREYLRPAIAVTVTPVVQRAGSAGGGTSAAPGEVVQAPGWLEADPYDVGVPALAEGVVKELLVLEGQAVEAGQVVARLVDDDAVLAKRLAAAELERTRAGANQAGAMLNVEKARTDEAKDALQRRTDLAASGAVSRGEVVSLELKLKAQQAAEAAALALTAHHEAECRFAQVALEQAELTLHRMEVRSPIAGVVLARLVVPGQRLMPDANNPFAGVVVRIYDPAHLQVRVDIPIADAAKVRIGDTVEVTTEAMDGRIFHAAITRFVHEANLLKNTVQVKAAIKDPAPELKPEMLAKARITPRPREVSANPASSPPQGAGGGGTVIIAPRAALLNIQGHEAAAWVVDLPTTTAQQRHLKLGSGTEKTIEVLEGLRPGDRLILNAPATLREGTRVKPTEATEEL